MTNSTSIGPTVIGPALGLSADRIRKILQLAARAPSVHNTQPWRFRIAEDRIELRSDPSRQLPVSDPDGRELRISCGAAALNAKLGLRIEGIEPLISIRPPDAPEAEAVLRRGERHEATLDEWRLGRAIFTWRTNRHPFLDTDVPVAHRAVLTRAARLEQAFLQVIDDAERRACLFELIRDAHRTQLANPAYRTEFGAWSARGTGRLDGVPVDAAGPSPEPGDPLPMRDFAQGRAQPRTAGQKYEPEPLIVVVATRSDTPADQVRAGMALQRVLLSATALGLATSFLSQPIEVAAQRTGLRELIGGALYPHAVLRMGFVVPTAPTPRRSVEDLLI